MITIILLIILSGAIMEIGIIFQNLSKKYTYYDYESTSKTFLFLFWAIISVALYGYYQEPLPMIIPIHKFSLKLIYHGFVILGLIYIGALITHSIYKNIFGK